MSGILPGRICFRFVFVLWLAIGFVVASVQNIDAADIPHPFEVAAEAAVLMDAGSGQLIYGQNPHQRIKPASFAKLLTLFLVFDAVEYGQVSLDDRVLISEEAWRTGGSKMFVKVGERVPLEELIKGIASVSGNDACVAVAEFLQGSEEAFVDRMGEKLKELGLENTRFQTVDGWPAPEQYTTPADMAALARAYIQEHPEALKYHSLKEFTHQNIHQRNRNGLLWRDPSVDGLKTGHTEDAGYHLLATARREDQRFIAAVMGAESEAVREREALRLLNYGFRNFTAVPLFEQGQVLVELPVWKGTVGKVGLTAAKPGVVTVRISRKEEVSWEAERPERVMAPVQQGQALGRAVIAAGQEVLKEVSLLADREVPQAGLLKRMLHSVALFSIDHGGFLILIGLLLVATAAAVWYLRKRRPRRKRSRHPGSR